RFFFVLSRILSPCVSLALYRSSRPHYEQKTPLDTHTFTSIIPRDKQLGKHCRGCSSEHGWCSLFNRRSMVVSLSQWLGGVNELLRPLLRCPPTFAYLLAVATLKSIQFSWHQSLVQL
ncbi:unnamed protein product, partial [Ectocarpus sp. 8 AP-2014]